MNETAEQKILQIMWGELAGEWRAAITPTGTGSYRVAIKNASKIAKYSNECLADGKTLHFPDKNRTAEPRDPLIIRVRDHALNIVQKGREAIKMRRMRDDDLHWLACDKVTHSIREMCGILEVAAWQQHYAPYWNLSEWNYSLPLKQ